MRAMIKLKMNAHNMRASTRFKTKPHEKCIRRADGEADYSVGACGDVIANERHTSTCTTSARLKAHANWVRMRIRLHEVEDDNDEGKDKDEDEDEYQAEDKENK